MANFHVRKGDEVVVIAGADRGKRGRLIAVLTGKDRVVVEGIAMMKRHMRKSQQHPNGAIVEREGSVHMSNVMRADNYDARQAKRSTTAVAGTKA